MLPIALVLIFSLLLPCGGASVRPAHMFSDRATGTSADIQVALDRDKTVSVNPTGGRGSSLGAHVGLSKIGLSEGYIPRLLILLSNIKDAEQDRTEQVSFRGTLLDGDGPMKRQEGNVAETPFEVSPIKQVKRKEGCKFFYYKTWTAC